MADDVRLPTCSRSSSSPPTARCGPGEATMVLARTADGDVGILPHHAPLLGTLADGAVLIRQESGDPVVAVVHGGFLSVADNRVGHPRRGGRPRPRTSTSPTRSASLQEARQSDDDDAAHQVRRAEARIRAARHGFLADGWAASGPAGRHRVMSLIVVLDVLAALVVVALLGLVLLVAPAPGHHPARRHLRLQPAASARAPHGKGWVLGIGRYAGDALEWYRVFSYSTRPRRVLSPRASCRSSTAVSRPASRSFSLLAGAVVVTLPRRRRERWSWR